MVVQAFPIAKLGYLAIKQISKPIAAGIKNTAKRNAHFRNFVCLPVANFYHTMEMRFKMYLLGLGKPTHVTTLNEELAVALGADILGETVVFVFAAVTLYWEYARQASKAKAKEDDLLERLNDVENKLNILIEQNRAKDLRVNEVLQAKSSQLPPAVTNVETGSSQVRNPNNGEKASSTLASRAKATSKTFSELLLGAAGEFASDYFDEDE